jgi:hypothetical protein
VEDAADVSEIYVASIFRVEVVSLDFFCATIYAYVSKKGIGEEWGLVTLPGK